MWQQEKEKAVGGKRERKIYFNVIADEFHYLTQPLSIDGNFVSLLDLIWKWKQI